MKRLIIFDLDGTLAESKSPLAPEMAALLGSLLEVAKVAIISGGAWPQFQTQILPRLTAECRLQDLYLLPTCGTKFYRHDTTWTPLYADEFTTEQKDVIIAALKLAMDESGFAPARYWGEVIEDRGGQITMSALGQEAPLEEKKIWDPDFAKRRLIQRRLAELIPDFSVRLGGATSIDVTKMGVDKAFGIGMEHLLRMQLAYDVAQARAKSSTITVRRYG